MVSAHKLLHMALWDIRVSFSGFDKTPAPISRRVRIYGPGLLKILFNMKKQEFFSVNNIILSSTFDH